MWLYSIIIQCRLLLNIYFTPWNNLVSGFSRSSYRRLCNSKFHTFRKDESCEWAQGQTEYKKKVSWVFQSFRSRKYFWRISVLLIHCFTTQGKFLWRWPGNPVHRHFFSYRIPARQTLQWRISLHCIEYVRKILHVIIIRTRERRCSAWVDHCIRRGPFPATI